MKGKMLKRIMAGVCAASVLTATPVLAAEKEITGTNPGSNTSVEAEVVESSQVTYVIQIPEKVDFGQIVQPNSSGTAYTDISITVKCTQVNGLASNQALAVMVKDSDAIESTDPFKLKKEDNADVVLTYSILNREGNNIQDLRWYQNGFLFGSFTAAGQEETDILRLDRGQLYGKDLSVWGGKYAGTLNFYSKIASISDVNP